MFKIAFRNLLRNKRRTLIAFILVFAGFSFTVLYYAFVLGWLYDFPRNMIDSFLADIRIDKKGYSELKPYKNLMEENLENVFKNDNRIENYSRRLTLYGMVATAENWKNVLIIGAEHKREKTISNWSKRVDKGDYLSDDKGDYILIDKKTAETIKADTGSRVVIMLQDAEGNIESKSFEVKGILNIIGFNNFILMPLKKLQKVSKLGERFTAHFIKVRKGESLKEIDTELEMKLSSLGQDYLVKTWKERIPYYESMFNLSRIIFFIYFSFIYLTAAIGILNIIYMSVSERRRELGIMRAIGMKGREVLYLVLYESFILLTAGILGGGIATIGMFKIWERFGLDLSLFGQGLEFMGLETKLYPSMDIWGVIGAVLMIYIMGIFAGLYPAIKASKLNVVEVLRSIQ